ncbi:hypothetical protein ACKFKF_00760 [Phormidesmis sp. 146-12]
MNDPTIELIELADSFKQTRVYEEAKEEGRLEGILEGKLECVPRSLKFGLTLEQIAYASDLEVETVRRAALEREIGGKESADV